MNYRETVSIDPDRAPITYALVMKFNAVDADISTADESRQLQASLDGMYALLGDIVLAIHQLETGELPTHVRFPEDPQEE